MKFMIPFLFVLRLYASDCLCTIAGTTKIADNGSFVVAGDGYVTIAGGVTAVSQAAGQSYLHSTAGNTVQSAAQCLFDIPSSIAGIAHRWRASDLNASPVTNWVDEIQGFHWTQASGTAPTWDTNGVHFNGSSQQLDSTNLILNSVNTSTTNESVLIVFKLNATTADKMILCNSLSGGAIVFGVGDTPAFLYTQNSADVGPIGLDTVDFIVAQSVANRFDAYTNGVSGWNSAATWEAGVLITHVGSAGGSAYCNVDLREVIQWTNQPTWTSAMVSNIHYYSTNTYSFSP